MINKFGSGDHNICDTKVIFFDIDGTLLPLKEHGGNGKPLKSTAMALKKLKENGHIIVIATGKARYMMDPLLHDLGVEFDFLIGSNGQVVTDSKYNIIYEDKFSKDEIKDILDWSRKNEVVLGFQGLKKGTYVPLPHNEEILHTMEEALGNANVIGLESDEKFHHEKSVYQSLIFGLEKSMDKLKFDSDKFRLIRWHGHGYDLVKHDAHKAKGIEAVLKYLNIDKKHTYGFGDGLNDIEMFEFVNIAVIMENASDEVKDLVKNFKNEMVNHKEDNVFYITGSTMNDGIYNGLEKLGLI